MRKCARIYRVGADGCRAGVGRVATTGRTPCDKGCAAGDDGYAARDDESAVHDDGYGSLKKIERRWVRNTQRRVQGRAKTSVAQATMAEIAQRRVAGWVSTGRGSSDDGSNPAWTRRLHNI